MPESPFDTLDSESAAPDPAQAAREAAFSAPTFRWKDIPLHPFAIARELDWAAHCEAVGLLPLDQVGTDPRRFTQHGARLLWFCAVDESEWLSINISTRNPALRTYTLEIAIRQWINQHIPPDEIADATALAIQIWDRSSANRASIIPSEDDPEGNASGLSASRSTSASSHRPAPDSSPSTRSSTISPRSAAGPTSTAKAPPTASSTTGPKRRSRKKPRSAPASR